MRSELDTNSLQDKEFEHHWSSTTQLGSHSSQIATQRTDQRKCRSYMQWETMTRRHSRTQQCILSNSIDSFDQYLVGTIRLHRGKQHPHCNNYPQDN